MKNFLFTAFLFLCFHSQSSFPSCALSLGPSAGQSWNLWIQGRLGIERLLQIQRLLDTPSDQRNEDKIKKFSLRYRAKLTADLILLQGLSIRNQFTISSSRDFVKNPIARDFLRKLSDQATLSFKLSHLIEQLLANIARVTPDDLSERKDILVNWEFRDPQVERNPTAEGDINFYQNKADEVYWALMGLNHKAVELGRLDSPQTRARSSLDEYAAWSFRNAEHGSSLWTPAWTAHFLLRRLALPPGATVVDVGSGYGHLGFLIGLLRPDLKYIGIEIVPERAQESSRVARLFGFENVTILEKDLSAPNFKIPAADAYYFYDPVGIDTGAKVLSEIKDHANANSLRKVQLVVRLASTIDFDEDLEVSFVEDRLQVPIVFYSIKAKLD